MIAFRAEWVSFEGLVSEKSVLVKPWCGKGEPFLKLSANKLIQQTAKSVAIFAVAKMRATLPAADEVVSPLKKETPI